LVGIQRTLFVVLRGGAQAAPFLFLALASSAPASERACRRYFHCHPQRAARRSACLVDVDPQTLNLDPAAAERAITPRTKAIIPVHVSGRAADLGAISDIAKRHGVLVIEDAAEAFLSKHRGKYLGTFGSAGCFSLSPNKTITSGQGGLVVTDDDQLHVRLRELRIRVAPRAAPGATISTTALATILSSRIYRPRSAWLNSKTCRGEPTE
jgi:hypothetical protein